jgi:hypothetical protein
MTTHENPHTVAAEQMKTIKAAWDAAPAGVKKDAAEKHYKAAESAFKANNDKECMRSLDEAKKALN